MHLRVGARVRLADGRDGEVLSRAAGLHPWKVLIFGAPPVVRWYSDAGKPWTVRGLQPPPDIVEVV